MAYRPGRPEASFGASGTHRELRAEPAFGFTELSSWSACFARAVRDTGNSLRQLRCGCRGPEEIRVEAPQEIGQRRSRRPGPSGTTPAKTKAGRMERDSPTTAEEWKSAGCTARENVAARQRRANVATEDRINAICAWDLTCQVSVPKLPATDPKGRLDPMQPRPSIKPNRRDETPRMHPAASGRERRALQGRLRRCMASQRRRYSTCIRRSLLIPSGNTGTGAVHLLPTSRPNQCLDSVLWP